MRRNRSLQTRHDLRPPPGPVEKDLQMRFTLVRLVATTALSLVVGLGLLAPSTALAATTQVTATTAVNVRKGPSTSAAIIGGLYRGQTVTSSSAAKGWTKISYKGKTGY